MTDSDHTEGQTQSGGDGERGCRTGRPVTFFAPSLKHFETSELSSSRDCTLFPVSVTGSDCSLGCDHCRGQILARMPAAVTPDELFAHARSRADQGAAGLLVSGGSDSLGRVPLEPFLPTLGRIREELGMAVAVHTGITDPALAAGLAAARVATVLTDVIGADATIRDVCHLDGITTDDYDASLDCLCDAGLHVVPHVVIGLHRGAVKGELEALRLIRDHDVAAVVLVGLRPLPGTPMAGLSPVEPAAMGRLFLAARELFADKQVMLGCERPAGAHKEETDRLALEAGLDGIAYPADGAVAQARAMGRDARFSGMCCAMPVTGNGGDRKAGATDDIVSWGDVRTLRSRW